MQARISESPLRAITESAWFNRLSTFVILMTALLMGYETTNQGREKFAGGLELVNAAVQFFFVVEIALRWLACRPDYRAFLRDGWNVFDVTVVAISFVPAAGPFALVARLARLLRVARLVSRSSDLRLIIDTMLRSIPSLFHVSILMGLLLYIYGVLGFHLFHGADPAHWGSLALSWLTLFKILTLEGWIEMLQAVTEQVPWAWMYFVSYIILAVFVVVNLFIAVVINNLQTVRSLNAATESDGQ